MTGKQSSLEQFLKRKKPQDGDTEDDDGQNIRPDSVQNINHSASMHRSSSSRIARKDVNLDELPYDPADRRRISDYIGQKL